MLGMKPHSSEWPAKALPADLPSYDTHTLWDSSDTQPLISVLPGTSRPFCSCPFLTGHPRSISGATPAHLLVQQTPSFTNGCPHLVYHEVTWSWSSESWGGGGRNF